MGPIVFLARISSFVGQHQMEIHDPNGQQRQQYHYIWEISDVQRLQQVQNILFISETSLAPLTNLSEFFSSNTRTCRRFPNNLPNPLLSWTTNHDQIVKRSQISLQVVQWSHRSLIKQRCRFVVCLVPRFFHGVRRSLHWTSQRFRSFKII